MKKTLLFFTLSLWVQIAAFSQVKISILLADSFNKAAYEAIDQLKDTPGFNENNSIQIFPTDNFLDRDLNYLESSDLIFVYVHQPLVFEQAKPYILKALKNGAKVYGLGHTPGEEGYKQLGVIFDNKISLYFAEGGVKNLKNMVLNRLNHDFKQSLDFAEITKYPDCGIYLQEKDSIMTDLSEYISVYPNYKPGNPWVGIYMFRYEVVNEQHQPADAIQHSLENAGFNVLPFFGYPLANAIDQFCIDPKGIPTIDFLVNVAFIQGGTPDGLRERFSKMKIPVIDAIELNQSKEEWDNSKTGIDIFRRSLHLSVPELSGQIQPIVISGEENVTTKNGTSYTEKTPIFSQVKKLTNRILAWNNLQQKHNKDKNIALVYYSYPPGKENIGASYLNVLPKSILNIMNKMHSEGYNLGENIPDSISLYNDIMDHGRNVGNWAPAEIARMVKTGEPVLIPVSEYSEWFSKLASDFRSEVLKNWGKPEDAEIMTWTDKKGIKYFVLPAVHYGNLLLTPQPARGWGQDINKLYHDVTMPPHHQYIAFYLYLKYSMHADAVIHLGTHGTHEWLSGKEAGLGDNDAPEALINDLINIYPYIVDDVGEGLQAKRRGMAIVIDHLTPPFDKADMNPELHELTGLISEYDAASEKSEQLAESKWKQIQKLAEKQGLLKDLGLTSPLQKKDVHLLEDYANEIAEKQTPFGLHTFGKSPDEAHAQKTAEAIVGRLKGLSNSEKEEKIKDLKEKLSVSGEHELNALMTALNGHYVEAAQGNDPLRNPASLPTGKNFYAFDPSKIPSGDVYETGSKLAEELVEEYRKKHDGAYPDKVTFNLWSTETIRHEGVMEAQIMKLLGIKPKFDAYGRVTDVDVIPRKILNRPRIDVVLTPSGLYRDLFSNVMSLLDKAVKLAKEQDEVDNYVRKHILAAKEILMKQGITDEKMAERLASVRMFSVPSGGYGTGLNDVIQESGSWDEENEVIGVYFNRMSHLYGQGFWGDKPEDSDASLPDNFSINLMKQGMSGTKVVVHSRSTNLYGALDNDDFFQYLGGATMAIRSIDGESPDVMVTNLSNPSQVGQETLDKMIGREMKSRYLNPKWINEMLDEGYAGARMINKVVANLWGWQVTAPDAIDENKWQQMYETYVEDKYQLDIKKKFRDAKNMYAYQTALSRMIEVVRKDYWHPDEKVMETLIKEYQETIKEVGLSCNGNVCNNADLKDFVETKMSQIQGLPPEAIKEYNQKLNDLKKVVQSEQTVPDPDHQIAKTKADPNLEYVPKTEVKGYKVETVSSTEKNQKLDQQTKIEWGLVALGILFLLGFIFNREKKI